MSHPINEKVVEHEYERGFDDGYEQALKDIELLLRRCQKNLNKKEK